jgi:hypothetical protein
MSRAMSVALPSSSAAPVEISPSTSVSAARPPSSIASRLRSSPRLAR